ncbi:STAM-binding protein-like A [Pseudolycoriella hygida]|uniref:STAM-binding protein-like A n=1 Tax=Pseudolycoriella hygida TaxID=35572 RepID=A0A9Q0S8Z3_9DIPT|nr:STAM-binding protein-like A [Pseudolycoriella hygida]
MYKIANFTGMGIVDPQERIKHLANYGNMFDVDANVPIRRYYRSGMEMVRMATVYHNEGNLENAYIFYIKFMTLFLDKILSHPEYKTVPSSIKKPNQDKLKEILPLTENLKLKLLERYKEEYKHFIARKKEAERVREAEQAEESLKNKKPSDVTSLSPIDIASMSAKPEFLPSAPSDLLDQVVYPNDFPSSANKTNLPTGLILPDTPKPTPAKPSIDRSLKPMINESLAEGNLRSVLIPKDTMFKFLLLAAKNTANNVETCGILAGRLAQNQLLITHVIVPKQNGTSDSCTTMNEEDIFDIQDQQNLITLGWIHTHPSQTAFLSSVDLHTHCSYQIMMPEAIAIVCAPKYQETGFFCLTPNYGLEFIARCRQTGFHPHPNDPPLFMVYVD